MNELILPQSPSSDPKRLELIETFSAFFANLKSKNTIPSYKTAIGEFLSIAIKDYSLFV